MEWTQVIDVSDRVTFHVPPGHTYTNEYVVFQYDPDDYGEDEEYLYIWYVVVYDGWDGNHSGSSNGHQLPLNWDVL